LPRRFKIPALLAQGAEKLSQMEIVVSSLTPIPAPAARAHGKPPRRRRAANNRDELAAFHCQVPPVLERQE